MHRISRKAPWGAASLLLIAVYGASPADAQEALPTIDVQAELQARESRPVTLRIAVENVLDNNYWATTGLGLLTAGAPRMFLVSTTVDF